MPQPDMIPDPTSAAPVACQNCEWTGTESGLLPVLHYFQRVAPGEIAPAGECPECGALAHLAARPSSVPIARAVDSEADVHIWDGSEMDPPRTGWRVIDPRGHDFGAMASEDEAAAFQRGWRAARGLNPWTGEPIRTAPDGATEIAVTVDGEPPFRETLARFLAANRDGIDPEEAAAIRAAVAAGRAVIIGGGAAPSVEIAPARD